MKKTGIFPVAVTFSLADFPSEERVKLEEQIIGRWNFGAGNALRAKN